MNPVLNAHVPITCMNGVGAMHGSHGGNSNVTHVHYGTIVHPVELGNSNLSHIVTSVTGANVASQSLFTTHNARVVSLKFAGLKDARVRR